MKLAHRSVLKQTLSIADGFNVRSFVELMNNQE